MLRLYLFSPLTAKCPLKKTRSGGSCKHRTAASFYCSVIACLWSSSAQIDPRHHLWKKTYSNSSITRQNLEVCERHARCFELNTLCSRFRINLFRSNYHRFVKQFSCTWNMFCKNTWMIDFSLSLLWLTHPSEATGIWQPLFLCHTFHAVITFIWECKWVFLGWDGVSAGT